VKEENAMKGLLEDKFISQKNRFYVGTLLLAFLAFSGCGGKTAKVTTGIEVASSLSFLNSSGGTLVAGQHNEGHSFSHFFPAGQTISVEMELGSWDLVVVTYVGGSQISSSTVECALGNFNISEESSSISLTVNSENCGNAGVKKIKMRACAPESFASIAAPVNTACIGEEENSAGSQADSMAMRSFKVSYLSHSNLIPAGTPFDSECITEDLLESSNLALFTGDHLTVKQVPMAFKFFATADCSESSSYLPIKPNLVDTDQKNLIQSYNVGNFNKFIFLNAESDLLSIVTPENTRPYIITGQKIQHYMLEKGNTLTTFPSGINLFADAENDELSFSCYYDQIVDGKIAQLGGIAQECSSLPGALFDSTLGQLTWTIPANADDSYEFKIIATDGDLNNNAKFILNTIEPNVATGGLPLKDGLKVWLQPKPAYLYKNLNLSAVASEGDQVVAWRNTIMTSNDKPLMATTSYNNGPIYTSEVSTSFIDPVSNLNYIYTPEISSEKTLSFNSSLLTALALDDGHYDDNTATGAMTVIMMFTKNTLGKNTVDHLFSKGNVANNNITVNALLNPSQAPIVSHTNQSGHVVENNFSSYNAYKEKTCLAYVINSDTGYGKLFINGTLDYAIPNTSLINTNEKFIIGNVLENPTTVATGLDGNIAEILIWSKALDGAQVFNECYRLDSIYN